MTQKEFNKKWSIHPLMLQTNNDFKMILLSNLSDLQIRCDAGYDPQSNINQIKSFIIDFYDTQPKSVDIDFLHPLTETK